MPYIPRQQSLEEEKKLSSILRIAGALNEKIFLQSVLNDLRSPSQGVISGSSKLGDAHHYIRVMLTTISK